MKILDIYCNSTPVNPKFGYGDDYKIISSDGLILQSGKLSISPIPYRSATGQPWYLFCGWMADGVHSFECIDHTWGKHFGKSLLINGGLTVTSRNPLHQGGIVKEVMAHSGGRKSKLPTWRGSTACITTHPEHWPEFIDAFNLGEKGKIKISTAPHVSEWWDSELKKFKIGGQQ